MNTFKRERQRWKKEEILQSGEDLRAGDKVRNWSVLLRVPTYPPPSTVNI